MKKIKETRIVGGGFGTGSPPTTQSRVIEQSDDTKLSEGQEVVDKATPVSDWEDIN
mgnify:CR=1 FL=1